LCLSGYGVSGLAAEAAAVKPYVMPGPEEVIRMWALTEQPVDYTFWLEQGMVSLLLCVWCLYRVV
jgi:hypothetical protein